MKWSLIFALLLFVYFTYADTIDIGGGGFTQCKADFTLSQPIKWHDPLFPIPVVIDSKMNDKKVTMYIYATVIWNKIYQSFLKKNFTEPKKYPKKLFSYSIVTDNYSDYEESPYIIWLSEKLLPIKVNGITEYFDKWYWVSDTIKGAHINLNTGKKWYFEENNPFSNNWNWPKTVDSDKIDFLTVALHELGHAIGLKHTTDSNNIMFPCTRRGERVYPTDKDIKKFFKNHDYEIKYNLLPILIGD